MRSTKCGAGQRRDTGHVQMISQEHAGARRPVVAQRAAGVREHERPYIRSRQWCARRGRPAPGPCPSNRCVRPSTARTCRPARSYERTTPACPGATGWWKPGRSANPTSATGCPSASAAPPQPEPSTIATSCRGTPVAAASAPRCSVCVLLPVDHARKTSGSRRRLTAADLACSAVAPVTPGRFDHVASGVRASQGLQLS